MEASDWPGNAEVPQVERAHDKPAEIQACMWAVLEFWPSPWSYKWLRQSRAGNRAAALNPLSYRPVHAPQKRDVDGAGFLQR